MIIVHTSKEKKVAQQGERREPITGNKPVLTVLLSPEPSCWYSVKGLF
jgi:hypothetical protein